MNAKHGKGFIRVLLSIHRNKRWLCRFQTSSKRTWNIVMIITTALSLRDMKSGSSMASFLSV